MSVTGYREEKDEEKDEIDFDKTYLSSQFLHYPITISTHVSLFNILFGTEKSNLYPLIHMANSVVILDEIQSYKNSIWKEIIVFLKSYSRLLNIKFIIMSATLPNLETLCGEKDGFITLIDTPSVYFENDLFKKRVKLDYSMINIDPENLFNCILMSMKDGMSRINNEERNSKILIEFITKKNAKAFLKFIKSKEKLLSSSLALDILFFSGESNLIDRRNIINKIKTERDKNIILVATQVIESGVDIDMDIGYKDISLLDLDEQFLGRINRNNKKKDSIAYFFNLDEASNIYKNDIRTKKEYTLLNNEMRDVLERKDFSKYYSYILKDLEDIKTAENEENFNLFIYRNLVSDINYHKIKEKLRLLDDDTSKSLFLERRLTKDGSIIDGREVWIKYLSILKDKDMSITKKKVLSKSQYELVQNFIYQVNIKDVNFPFDKDLSTESIYYIPNGDQFIINGILEVDLLGK